MHLSYPLGDVLGCLRTTREAGLNHPESHDEYARFRLAVYDWCIQNWHRVRLYHAEEQVFSDLKAEVEGGEPIFVEVVYRLSDVIKDESATDFVKWAVDVMAENDPGPKRDASKTILALDTALTLLFLSLTKEDLDKTQLLTYLAERQACAPAKSSFLSLLHMRLARPVGVVDPHWALTTIAETCFRGHLGDTPEARLMSAHELLGHLVAATARNLTSPDLRRRLEGSLHVFVTAGKNLEPYFGESLLFDGHRTCKARPFLAQSAGRRGNPGRERRQSSPSQLGG